MVRMPPPALPPCDCGIIVRVSVAVPQAMVDTARILLPGLIMDGIYQDIECDTFHRARPSVDRV
jgi:hypothetical protein